MNEPLLSFCKMCLFKVEEPFTTEDFSDGTIQLKTIIEEIFHGKVQI